MNVLLEKFLVLNIALSTVVRISTEWIILNKSGFSNAVTSEIEWTHCVYSGLPYF